MPPAAVRTEAEVERLLAEMQESYLSSVDDIMRQNASLRGVASRIADQRARAARVLEDAYAARPDIGDTFRNTAHEGGQGPLAPGDVLALVEVVLGLVEVEGLPADRSLSDSHARERHARSPVSKSSSSSSSPTRRRRDAKKKRGNGDRGGVDDGRTGARVAESESRRESQPLSRVDLDRVEGLVAELEGEDRAVLLKELRELARRDGDHQRELARLNDRHAAERATLAGIIDRLTEERDELEARNVQLSHALSLSEDRISASAKAAASAAERSTIQLQQLLRSAEEGHEAARESLASLRRRCAELEAECAGRVPKDTHAVKCAELEQAMEARAAAEREREEAESLAFQREKRLRERISDLENARAAEGVDSSRAQIHHHHRAGSASPVSLQRSLADPITSIPTSPTRGHQYARQGSVVSDTGRNQTAGFYRLTESGISSSPSPSQTPRRVGAPVRGMPVSYNTAALHAPID